MNNQESIALLREDIVTIDCAFIDNVGGQVYTFFAKESLAKSLEIDGMVLVDTQNGVKIAVVRSLDDKIGTGQLQSHIKYRYAFQKVSTIELEKIKEEEAALERELAQHRKSNARRQVREVLGVTEQDRKAIIGRIENKN